ncbi:hypothetical protein [Agrobacterium rubi]|uniref:Uncharacterized protein n=1 Tax=Agrobacterium rubi TaxID=28099 RepID=A0AAE7RCU0_9HYPH|nr:hypothetical protein [Agrobacterium rubi]NTE88996.1 hypothetical protein [Agrobacterium rubi]NTF04824.1 hypothetical protein [Agrobacterium rubi]NTF39385.1 hypothetical protein [Agrobacterium rubi]QTG03021.1 hypothetical protein G6M88_21920 [Agrobacterium rubi]
MSDFSKNPVEDKIMEHMRRYGEKMDELDIVRVKSKEDLDKTAETLGVNPSSYEGNEQAAIIFVKGAVVYGLMDQNERDRFLETLNRVWGKSRFTGEITRVVANRVLDLQTGMDWPDLPNPIFVKEYAAVIHAARMLDVPVSVAGWAGTGAALGTVGNAAFSRATGKAFTDTSKLGDALGKIGLNGTKVLNKSGLIGAGVALATTYVEWRLSSALAEAKQEAEKRILGKAKYTMTQEYFNEELKKYGLSQDVGAVK